jgi:hypothetical protein
LTVVVADLRPFVIPEVREAAVPVKFVATPLAGVPRAGFTSVELVNVPHVTVGVNIVTVLILVPCMLPQSITGEVSVLFSSVCVPFSLIISQSILEGN